MATKKMAKKYEYFSTPFGAPKKSEKRDHVPRGSHSSGYLVYYVNVAPFKSVSYQNSSDLEFDYSRKTNRHYPRDQRNYMESEADWYSNFEHGVVRKSQPRAYHVKGIPDSIIHRQHAIPYQYAANIQERIKLSEKEPRVIISPEELKYNPAIAIGHNLTKVARHKRVTRGKKSFRS